jgi:hypothetical protein
LINEAKSAKKVDPSVLKPGPWLFSRETHYEYEQGTLSGNSSNDGVVAEVMLTAVHGKGLL